MSVKLPSNIATAPNLDDLLLDLVTEIELSPRDRLVVEKRYRQLKTHLERPESPIAQYLADSESKIYPQGSISIGTTIITGKDEDRFDLDAIVEVKLPPGWPPKKGMDLLMKALMGFPDAVKIVRCTRCIQIQFASMHMDVTLMDPEKAPRAERAGEIFHSPEKGEDERVPANPYGFGQWWRLNIVASSGEFTNAVKKRRDTFALDRLELGSRGIDAIDQDNLPPVLPPHLDSEQAVAHKLMKRYVYQQYVDRDIKKPPTIYLAKLAVDAGPNQNGLFAQLVQYAQHIRKEMRRYLGANEMPDERNPSYRRDRLNDRWPKNRSDMEVLEGDMQNLIGALERARHAEFSVIAKVMADLFGKRVTQRTIDNVLERAGAALNQQNASYERQSGAVILPGTILAPAVVKSVSATPHHKFHSGVLKKPE